MSRTYLGRVGRDRDSYSAGFGGGITPVSGGYQSYTLGGDASVSWGEDLRWTAGMGSDFIRHGEFIPETPNRAGRRSTSTFLRQ